MPTQKCRYCGARKGHVHASNCRTRTSSTTYPDSTLYVTTYTDTSSSGSYSGSSDSGCSSPSDNGSSSSSGGGDCG